MKFTCEQKLTSIDKDRTVEGLKVVYATQSKYLSATQHVRLMRVWYLLQVAKYVASPTNKRVLQRDYIW